MAEKTKTQLLESIQLTGLVAIIFGMVDVALGLIATLLLIGGNLPASIEPARITTVAVASLVCGGLLVLLGSKVKKASLASLAQTRRQLLYILCVSFVFVIVGSLGGIGIFTIVVFATSMIALNNIAKLRKG